MLSTWLITNWWFLPSGGISTGRICYKWGLGKGPLKNIEFESMLIPRGNVGEVWKPALTPP